jgi:uncharacterized Zn finger protein
MADKVDPTREQADCTTEASCPKCGARAMIHRLSDPNIDSCGFENYFLKCNDCGAWLVGIIDPYDETLLLTELVG